MQFFHLHRPFLFSLAIFLPLAALGQTNSDVADRIDRLQRDVMVLQRQLSRGETPNTTSISSEDAAPISSGPVTANQEVRLSAIEEQMRQLRGQIEENRFQNKKLADDFEKFRKDTDFRLNEINQAQHTAVATPAAAPASSAATTPPAKEDAHKDSAKEPTGAHVISDDKMTDDKAAKEVKDKDTKEPADAKDTPKEEYNNPRDLYNHAFRLLNQTHYSEAAESFQAFTEKYPKDALIGNAFYWLGETHYIRRDYVKAADNFRQGFEAKPSGPKAADNLLKLALSLNAMEQNKEACVVLGQILVKFKDTSKGVVQKAGTERTRIGCK